MKNKNLKLYFLTFLLLAVLLLQACTNQPAPTQSAPTTTAANAYLDNSGRDEVLSGGVKMVPITTPKGKFNVWTKRVGNNPTIKVLLLHDGPGAHGDDGAEGAERPLSVLPEQQPSGALR